MFTGVHIFTGVDVYRCKCLQVYMFTSVNVYRCTWICVSLLGVTVYILSNDNHGYLLLRTEEFFCLHYDVKSLVSQPETVLHLT